MAGRGQDSKEPWDLAVDAQVVQVRRVRPGSARQWTHRVHCETESLGVSYSTWVPGQSTQEKGAFPPPKVPARPLRSRTPLTRTIRRAVDGPDC